MKKRYRNMQKKANGKVREIGDGSVLFFEQLSSSITKGKASQDFPEKLITAFFVVFMPFFSK